MATRTLGVRLTADTTDLRQGLQAASRSVGGFTSDISRATDIIASRSTLMAAGVVAATFAVVKGYRKTIAPALEFETTMRNVNSIMQLSERQFKATSTEVIDLSRTVPQSANTLAQGLYDVASSGFHGADAMTVLKQSSIAATAGLTDTATAVQTIDAVLNSYGLQASQATKVSDVLFQTVNLGILTFADLGAGIGEVAGIAAAAKVPIQDVLSAVATMTVSGAVPAEAFTSTARVIQSLINPGKELADVLQSVFHESGSAALAQYGLYGVMQRLRPVLGDSAEAAITLFGDIRAGRGVLELMTNDMRNYERVQKGVADGGVVAGATQRAFDEQMKSAGNQLALTVNNAKAYGIEIGTHLLPLVAGAARETTGFVNVLRISTGFIAGHSKEVEALAIVYGAQLIPKLLQLGAVSGFLDKLSLGVVNLAGSLNKLAALGLTTAFIAGILELQKNYNATAAEGVRIAQERFPQLLPTNEETSRVSTKISELIGDYRSLKGAKKDAAEPVKFDLDTSGVRAGLQALAQDIRSTRLQPPPGLFDQLVHGDPRVAQIREELQGTARAEQALVIAHQELAGQTGHLGLSWSDLSGHIQQATGLTREDQTLTYGLQLRTLQLSKAQRELIHENQRYITSAIASGASSNDLASALFSLIYAADPAPLRKLAGAQDAASKSGKQLANVTELSADKLKQLSDAATQTAQRVADAFKLMPGFTFPDASQAAADAVDAANALADAEGRLADAKERVRTNESYLTRTPQRDRELVQARKEQTKAENDLAAARKKSADAAETAKHPAQSLIRQARKQVANMTTFANNLKIALRKGVDPRFINDALSDPEKYGPVLAAIATATGTESTQLVQAINANEKALADVQTRMQKVAEGLGIAVDQGLSKLPDKLRAKITQALTAPIPVVAQITYESSDVSGTAPAPKPPSSQPSHPFGDHPRRHWALGGIDAHIASSPEVLFGERSTGGEAFIPLGFGHRGRSTILLADVAHRFGYGLVEMQRGGLLVGGNWSNGGTSGPVSHTVQHRYFENANITGPSMSEIERYADRKRRRSELMGGF